MVGLNVSISFCLREKKKNTQDFLSVGTNSAYYKISSAEKCSWLCFGAVSLHLCLEKIQ